MNAEYTPWTPWFRNIGSGLIVYFITYFVSYLLNIIQGSLIIMFLAIGIMIILSYIFIKIAGANLLPPTHSDVNRTIVSLLVSIALTISSILLWSLNFSAVIPILIWLILLILALYRAQISHAMDVKFYYILNKIAAVSVIASISASAPPIIGDFYSDETDDILAHQLTITNNCNFQIKYEIRGIGINLQPGESQKVPLPSFILIVAHHGSYISICDANGILDQIFKIPPNISIFISIDGQPLIPGDRKEICPDKDHELVIKN